MIVKRSVVAGLAALMLAALCGAQVWAQDYPTRGVTIVNPFAPGGGTDLLARLVARGLEQRLGQSFVIENKTGAGSIIAAVAVQKAAPDGYTLLMAPTPTMAVNVSLYKSLPYEPTDFIPLALLAQTPFVLIVHPSLPVTTVAELIAYSKANPGKLTFASVGPGVPHHLYMELLKGMTGIQATYVPYRGSLPALNDVIAGHVPMMFVDFGPAAGALQSGKVRPLGVSSKFRVPDFADIPPLNEAGVPGFDAVGWQMLVAPAKTPRSIVDRLNRLLTEFLSLPDTKEQIVKYGFVPVANRSVDELQNFVKSETTRWGKVVRDAGLAGTQ